MVDDALTLMFLINIACERKLPIHSNNLFLVLVDGLKIKILMKYF